MTCFLCKGSMEQGTTTYFADLGTTIIIIKNVPSHKCTQCGNVAYDLSVGERLEQIINSVKNPLAEISVVHYAA